MMLNGNTLEEKATIALRMTNSELFGMTLASLSGFAGEVDYPDKEMYRLDYAALRAELEKRLTRVGFLPAR